MLDHDKLTRQVPSDISCILTYLVKGLAGWENVLSTGRLSICFGHASTVATGHASTEGTYGAGSETVYTKNLILPHIGAPQN